MIAYDNLDAENENLNFWNKVIKKCVIWAETNSDLMNEFNDVKEFIKMSFLYSQNSSYEI